MAGVYIHIPFCKSRCRYCDFYSTTMLERRAEYVAILKLEMLLRTADFKCQLQKKGDQLNTIYFGGGTPSMLCEKDIADLISAIRTTLNVNFFDEITMEANPGDLTEEKLRFLREAGVNRLSIGIQSFNDTLLRRIGRRHSSGEAIEAVRMAKNAGFDNISIDLMYGLPGQTMTDWQNDVKIAIELDVQHVSAYCLTYEEGTPLYKALMSGEVEELDDELLNDMQNHLEAALEESGIFRYEISNYAKPGYESKHNGSYWIGSPYMGLGAGAHSYDGFALRQWNSDNIDAYISAISNGSLALESEHLSEVDQYNETVMLGLRTRNGINLAAMKEADMELILQKSARFISEGLLVSDNKVLRATHKGMQLLNSIIEELMKE